MTVQTSRRSFLSSFGAGTAAVAGVAVGLAGSTAIHAVGHVVSGDDHAADDPSAVDIGFCTDMTVHHVQAAAAEVLQTQAIEIGMMRAWLTDWGQSTAEPEMAMGWMGMNDGAGMPVAMMPGLASDEEMRALGSANGIEQGRLWIELMRAHHLGGVDMAGAAVRMAATEKVRRIAQVQVDVQTYEIGQYDLLLATDYG